MPPATKSDSAAAAATPHAPSPAEALRRRVREARDGLPKGVALPELLLALANRAETAGLLAQAFPGATAVELRRALSTASGLVRALEEWTERPAADVAARKKAGKAKAAAAEPPAGSASSLQPPVSSLDDPGAIAQHRAVKVHVDGASKGNPGPSSAGIVITDVEGHPVYEEGIYLGEMTNNAAEYRGLIRALELVSLNGRPQTFVFSDSLLMVNQMNLEWQVKHPDIQRLFSQAQVMKRRLPKFEIRHVGRELNKRADELANRAIKEERGGKRG